MCWASSEPSSLVPSEIFPYLVVVIGLENVLVLTKSVVSTPVDLEVKLRIAQGIRYWAGSGVQGWAWVMLFLMRGQEPQKPQSTLHSGPAGPAACGLMPGSHGVSGFVLCWAPGVNKMATRLCGLGLEGPLSRLAPGMFSTTPGPWAWSLLATSVVELWTSASLGSREESLASKTETLCPLLTPIFGAAPGAGCYITQPLLPASTGGWALC